MPEDQLVTDGAAIYPEVAALRAGLAARDWAACRAVLDHVAPGVRSDLLAGGSGVDPEFLTAVLRYAPDDADAAVLLAWHHITEGWRVRGESFAAYVDPAAWPVFHDRLRRAELVLMEAAARHPGDPAVWRSRLTTGRGLGVGPGEIRRRYARLSAIDPHHLGGQRDLLQSLCPKWGGSWDEASRFALDAMRAAPAGGQHGTLVAELHLERWLDLIADGAGPESDRAIGYLISGPVLGDLKEAAQRSVLHPDYRRDFGWVHAMSLFAMLFSLTGNAPAAARLFTELGPYASRSPWDRLGPVVETTVRERRARAFAEAGIA
ncbi:hypothetical protein ACTOB_001946 [Actinoplanes oblitus]|uniref:DUF4034 domain-containing protein n=1 Tax=Actinoplanes oblitus TaxID=3040509 RepID=A0ABY8WL26_9ACTN|nr:hypothetical protein [Actinoplanes oblitus]WIM98348.1 hypothetical protein ACTOB_001946 [Actinoplanes oblitus]